MKIQTSFVDPRIYGFQILTDRTPTPYYLKIFIINIKFYKMVFYDIK